MALTPEEFSNRLDNALPKIAIDMLGVMQESALTGKALLTRRIQSKGFGRRGYSRVPLPGFFFEGRWRNASGKAFYEENKNKGISYSEWRQANTLQNNFVDLTFTGDMFRGWRLPGTYRDELKIGGSVAGINEEVKDKLRWNEARFPNFDVLEQSEKDLLAEKLIKPRLIESIKQHLFQ